MTVRFSRFEPLPASHPDRLAVIAASRDVRVAPPGTSRVLELGCGDGSNLIPMASMRPSATFVGLDGAIDDVELGREAIDRLGLSNVELIAGDLDLLARRAERYDYVFLPGVLSNAPEDAARAAFALVAELLSPGGIVYADYLGASGRLLSGALRELLRRAASRAGTVAERLRIARALLEALDDDSFGLSDPHTVHARCELRFARSLSDGALSREVLAPHRRAYSPSAAAGVLAAHGLATIDAAWEPSLERRAALLVRKKLEPFGRGPVEAEDLVDFVTGTRRRALVACRKDAPRGSDAVGALLAHGMLAGRLETRLKDVLLAPGIEGVFVTRGGAMVRTSDPLAKAMLVALRDAWPEGRTFAALVQEASAMLAAAELPAPAEDAIARQQRELLDLHAIDAIAFCTGTREVATTLPRAPRVSPLTAWQASRSYLLTDPQHRLVAVDEVTRRLVTALDGTRDAGTLEAMIAGWAEAGEVSLEPDKEGAPAAVRIVERALAGLCKAGLMAPDPAP